MCGVVGIVSHSPVNQAIYDALTVLQHRGQDAAGIVTWGEDGLRQRKSNGLVRDVFRHRHMLRLSGNVGIGHIRYPTAGGSRASEAQPFYVNSPYGICLGHNGNLTNQLDLRNRLVEEGAIFRTSSDSEILVHLIAKSRHATVDAQVDDALVAAEVHGVFFDSAMQFRQQVV